MKAAWETATAQISPERFALRKVRMSRNDRDPADILASGRAALLGEVRHPELRIQNQDGTVDAFPLVCAHAYSDNFANSMANLIGNVVEQVLIRHGLITVPPQAEPVPIPDDHAVA